MYKKITVLILSGILMFNLSGCFALFVGAVGGAGTAVWLSGKLTQEFHASYDSTVDATKEALKTLNLQIVKETHDPNTTQFKGSYTDGREMWVDIHRVSERSTKVEVRIGGVNPDKVAANRVLKEIQNFMY